MNTAQQGRAVNDIVNANRALAVGGQSDMVWGHVALRDQDGRGVWMKAAGWGFGEVDAERVVLVSPQGDVVVGSGRRHIEYPIHTEILSRRPDDNAVVHTHAAAAATFASLDIPLLALTHDAAPFLQPDVPRFELSGDLIRDAKMGAALAATLASAAGVLIPGHGLVVVGPDLATAVMRAVLLDRACKNHLDALQAGGPARWSSDNELASKRAALWTPDQYHAGYDFLVRQAAAPFARIS